MGRWVWTFLILAISSAAQAQTSLLAANSSTVVRRVDFEYQDADRYPPRYTTAELREHVATAAPNWFSRLKAMLGDSDRSSFVLDPIELQRDVVRLRTLLNDAGYVHARVDYGASTVDPATNEVSVRFTIEQGPPLIIQDVGFYALDGYLANALDGPVRERWVTFRDQTRFSRGDPFTYFDAVRLEDAVLNWLKNEGYAFASLYSLIEVDSLYHTVDISFLVDPGPPGTIDSISITGASSSDAALVRRTLSFEEGEPYRQNRLLDAQRALFALNLFSVVQVDTPPQPIDSTVDISVTVTPARLRHISAETGYHQRQGLHGEGQWTHRNFLSGGRTLVVTGALQSGLLASAGLGATAPRAVRAAVALTQPHLGWASLTGVLEPFIRFDQDPLLEDTDALFGINQRVFGLNATLIHGLELRRPVSLRYALSRTRQFAASHSGDRDSYDRSTLTLGGTLAWTDNLLRPRRGVIIRPLIEQAGRLEAWLGAPRFGVSYTKAQLQIAGYLPLARGLGLTTRVEAGRLWPAGIATTTIYGEHGARSADAQFVQPLENRFDAVRLYAGGADNVRGWANGLIGPKVNHTSLATGADGNPRFENNLPVTQSERYEPVGGLAQASAGAEVQLRLSGPWHAAGFIDAGLVSARSTGRCTEPVFSDPERTAPLAYQCGITDSGRLDLGLLKLGAGVGLRYDTPIGFLRLDLAAKINPDASDLQSPRDAFLAEHGYIGPQRRAIHRFNVHFSIGQAL